MSLSDYLLHEIERHRQSAHLATDWLAEIADSPAGEASGEPARHHASARYAKADDRTGCFGSCGSADDTQARKMVLTQRLHRTRLVHAPHVLDLEITSALRRHCALGSLTQIEPAKPSKTSSQHAGSAASAILPIWPASGSYAHNFSAYDASYLALAEALGATLLTRDQSPRVGTTCSGEMSK